MNIETKNKLVEYIINGAKIEKYAKITPEFKGVICDTLVVAYLGKIKEVKMAKGYLRKYSNDLLNKICLELGIEIEDGKMIDSYSINFDPLEIANMMREDHLFPPEPEKLLEIRKKFFSS